MKDSFDVEIFWPNTGETQTFTDLPLDSTLRVTEGREGYETVALEKVVLGGG